MIGREALQRLHESSVLLIGCRGLGVEIAKNAVLMGLQRLTLADASAVELADLSSNFFLDEAAVGQNRAEAVAAQLGELNPRVAIATHRGPLDDDFLRRFTVVVATSASSLDELLRLNAVCRAHGTKFVLAESRGLFGAVFCDFGPAHSVTDRNGEPPKQAHINWVSNERPGVVHCVDTERHDLEDGDLVTISEVEGMPELNGGAFRATVLNPYAFSIGADTTAYGKYAARGVVRELKAPVAVAHASLADALRRFDFAKAAHPNGERLLATPQYFLFLQALLAFQAAHEGRAPRPYHAGDMRALLAAARAANAALEPPLEEVDEALLRQLAYTCGGDLCPMAAFVGGVAAQELMKAVSGKYTPLDQWLFFDALDAVHIPDDDAAIRAADFQPRGCRYDGQIAVFGADFQARLADLRYFLVGSGAIGCEMLKNWAMLGVATGPRGQVHVTDMDTIEVSNLNRQFLFRAADVGQPKAEVAARAARRMNPALRVRPSTVRVAQDTAAAYPPSFWEGLDGVCNALDNVEARRYVDRLCVRYGKSLLESGTLGPKGNVQVVVPALTESYSSSADPPQPGIPLCTMQSFPSRIEHTLAWARQIVLEALFVERVDNVRKFYADPDFVRKLPAVSRRTTVANLEEDLVAHRPRDFDDCIHWARDRFEEYFHNVIVQLLHVFPRDYKDKDGNPFWTGSKRPPTPLSFDAANPFHRDFVVFAAFLRAYCFGIIPSEFKPADYEQQIQRIAEEAQRHTPPPFVPKTGLKIETDPAAAAPAADDKAVVDDSDDDAYIARITPKLAALGPVDVHPIEFEKDDDRNFHVDFVNAASNLRALAYEIPTVDRLQSKLIAGKIIPAMITTTATVAGLVCFELYKLFATPPRTIAQYKNTFFNLAVSTFQQGEPVSAASVSGGTYRGKPFTLWDRIDIKRGDLTLQELFDYFRDEEGIEVDMVGYGQALLYSGWMPPAKQRERRSKKVSEIAAEVTGTQFGPEVTSFPIEIMGEDQDGQEVSVMPAVYYHFR